MSKIKVPGWKDLSIKNLVFDANGTLLTDGKINPEIVFLSTLISKTYNLNLYILTAATRGIPKKVSKLLRAKLEVIEKYNQPESKSLFLRKLGAEETIAIGNGANDELMLKEASLGIAVIGKKGASSGTIIASDVVVSNIKDALELLLCPERLKASLRR